MQSVTNIKLKGGEELMAKNNTSIRLEKKTRLILDKIATKKQRKTTELIRMILEDYVSKVEDLVTDTKISS